jgi:hypothetical protein
LTLNEGHRLRVFENRVLRRIFGPKREEMVGDWRRLHNDKLHNFYAYSDIIKSIKSRKMRFAGYVARMGKIRNSYKMLAKKTERKRRIGRPRRRLGDNVKMS